QPALDPRGLWQMGHLGAVDQDPSGIRLQRAGHQVDKAGLAGAVRPDQRVAGAALQAKIDRIRHLQRAKTLAQRAGLERGLLRFAHRRSRSISPKMPPRANTTTSTINSPIPKYQ